MTPELLACYAECVNKAVGTVQVPALNMLEGSVTFSITPIYSTHQMNLLDVLGMSISYSPFVKGIELEKASEKQSYLKDFFADGDFTDKESAHLLLFADHWKNNQLFKKAIMNKLSRFNQQLKKLFPSANPECDLINLKVSSTDGGWVITATDITPNVFEFTQTVLKSTRKHDS